MNHILGNTNSARIGVTAIREELTISKAAKMISTGDLSGKKINPYITIFNSNNTGKGKPRLCALIKNMPAEVISSTLSPADKLRVNGDRMRVMTRDVRKLQELAASARSMRFLNGKMGGGALAFGPSALLDLIDSISRDAHGDFHFAGRQFMINEAKNQSGNLVGYAGGAAVGGIIVLAGFAGAPVIIGGLIAGIFFQAIWNSSGASSWAGTQAERLLDR